MFLLDTDTVIYSLNGDAAVVRNLTRHRLDPLRISAVTLLELYYGAYKSEQTTANLAKIRRIADAFDVIAVDGTVAETFGMLKAQLENAGTPLDDFDLAIAACALSYNLKLVTNNEKHFLRVPGLRVENWHRE